MLPTRLLATTATAAQPAKLRVALVSRPKALRRSLASWATPWSSRKRRLENWYLGLIPTASQPLTTVTLMAAKVWWAMCTSSTSSVRSGSEPSVGTRTGSLVVNETVGEPRMTR